MLLNNAKTIPTQWDWENVIIRGRVNMVVAKGGKGKGIWTTDYISRITRGAPNAPLDPRYPGLGPEDFTSPAYVIYVSLEDDIGEVVARLKAAGADLSKVDLMSQVETSSDGGSVSSRPFQIPMDLGLLRRRIKELKRVRLVVIDPIVSAAKSTISFNQQMREHIINPLEQVARETGVSILIVNHYVGGTINPDNREYKVCGSKGLVDACRCVTYIEDDPFGDPDVRIMGTMKSNGGVKITQRFKICGPRGAPYIKWEMPPPAITSLSIRQIMMSVIQSLPVSGQPALLSELLAYHDNYTPQVVQQVLAMALEESLAIMSRGGYMRAPELESPHAQRAIEAPRRRYVSR